MSLKKKIEEIKRDLILEEASKLFQSEGYENMKIADLASIVGVSVGSIYTLFGSKENLYNNYILNQIDYYLEILENEIKNVKDPYEKLKILTNIKFQAFTSHKNILHIGVNHPLFYINTYNFTDEDDVMMHVYMFISENIMEPLRKKISTTKTALEMTLLYDSLSTAMVKHWVIVNDDLMQRSDELLESFLLITKNR
ncbi:TetR/AcrR family transcriptional regulator [Sulfurimonas lithotrophica]|uniref:TetR/AcrR family transcriptional regulator n=1 Tax=Sulfurimonas lithotrophica TaxID=2590022 RepID=A0A5P8P050_9BACT|nr:TetR/AcrR family transcriptional regulator [Sulfurimonas lithotrophica]QFR49088.1 TetR/AcrR family transcriptional regulator [Sulfurimonas lithotrophica]